MTFYLHVSLLYHHCSISAGKTAILTVSQKDGDIREEVSAGYERTTLYIRLDSKHKNRFLFMVNFTSKWHASKKMGRSFLDQPYQLPLALAMFLIVTIVTPFPSIGCGNIGEIKITFCNN